MTDLYVVLLVTRTHHAVVYEMPTAAAPEKAIANSRKFRVSSGLSSSGDQHSMRDSQEHGRGSQIPYEICMRPVFCNDREDGQNRD